MGEQDQGQLQLSLEQIQQALGTLNQFQEAAVRQVLDQMAGKMRQMENVIRALRAQVPPPEPPEDEEHPDTRAEAGARTRTTAAARPARRRVDIPWIIPQGVCGLAGGHEW